MKYIPDVFGSVIAVERKAWGKKKKKWSHFVIFISFIRLSGVFMF